MKLFIRNFSTGEKHPPKKWDPPEKICVNETDVLTFIEEDDQIELHQRGPIEF